MRFINAGKYNGNESSLPQREHPKGHVPFKEVEDTKQLGIIASAISVVLLIIFLGLFIWRAGFENILSIKFWVGFIIGSILSLVCMVPHEFLHAIWFKGDVYMYQNLGQGMLFVVGNGDFSKAKFIWMSLFPSIIFGLIPYAIFMIYPQFAVLGALGTFSLGAGAGDYYNIYNVLTQMPKGSLTYLSGFHSFWYMPENS